ncbi:MAG: hypothetical protein KF722_04385 [Nitrospira sp.]|nr:hypothetical protein [Nitrospira sp.]
MKPKTLLTVLALVLVLAGFTYTYNSVQFWGFDGITRAKEWVSPDGRMSLQAQLPNQSTAIDMWPTSGTTPTEHSLAELTLNRYQWDNPAMERINLSAMVNQTDGGAYRIGIERGGTGQYRPLIFCFEATSPGVATCPLKITENGVFVKQGAVYTQIGWN